MSVSFKFKEEQSPLFGTISRPIAEVYFRSRTDNIWQPVTMLVDTGADYTLLPRFLAPLLGVRLTKDCIMISTQGVGGPSNVYLLKEPILVRLGSIKLNIPIGFLESDYIPPLLGRHKFLEVLSVLFKDLKVIFDQEK